MVETYHYYNCVEVYFTFKYNLNTEQDSLPENVKNFITKVRDILLVRSITITLTNRSL